MSRTLTKTNYYMRCLKENLASIGTVFETLIYELDQLLLVFGKEIQELTTEAALQAGQLSLNQRALTEPLTLMSLVHHLQSRVFRPVALAHDLLQNGVMDFIIAEDDQH
jgi:hypothetical protein